MELYTGIADSAAEQLLKFEYDLFLNGLTSLSVKAANSLSKHKQSLKLDGLKELSDATAKALSEFRGCNQIHLNKYNNHFY